jgi:hypothetical protein
MQGSFTLEVTDRNKIDHVTVIYIYIYIHTYIYKHHEIIQQITHVIEHKITCA